MKKTRIVIAMAALAAVTWFCGCASNPNQKYVLHDTVYGDYYQEGKWTQDKSKADQMTYWQAKRWLQDWRVNERGEYADTGAKDYPVKIEPAN